VLGGITPPATTLEGTTMKLYYSPGACSLSPHIVLREAGLPFTLVRASTKTHKLDDGTDYYTINPKGYVPLLELDDGQRLSEGPAIVQYIADRVPAKQLAPAAGTLERYRLMEWLNFITSELHKSYGAAFNPALDDAAKQVFRQRAAGRMKWVDSQLEGRQFLLGETFTVADAYLYTIAGWSAYAGVDIAGLERLKAYMERVAARPAVQQALAAEKG
jgi:glutathione S-transferase